MTHEGHIYPGAVHGFNNDATPQRYNKAAADAGVEAHDRLVQQVRPRVGALDVSNAGNPCE